MDLFRDGFCPYARNRPRNFILNPSTNYKYTMMDYFWISAFPASYKEFLPEKVPKNQPTS
jgi:hypothetical protein